MSDISQNMTEIEKKTKDLHARHVWDITQELKILRMCYIYEFLSSREIR